MLMNSSSSPKMMNWWIFSSKFDEFLMNFWWNFRQNSSKFIKIHQISSNFIKIYQILMKFHQNQLTKWRNEKKCKFSSKFWQECRNLLDFRIWSGAKACKSGRSRKMLQNVTLLAIVAIHTAANEPPKVRQVMNKIHRNVDVLRLTSCSKGVERSSSDVHICCVT